MVDVPVDSASAIAVRSPPVLVSCGINRIYGVGALPADLQACAALADSAEFALSVRADLFPTARYHWQFPANGFVFPTPFTEDLGGFYASMATRSCPQAVLVRLQGAVLSGSVLYSLSESQTAIVYETFRPNDRGAVTVASNAHLREANVTLFSDPGWQNLFIGSAGSSNYGHWLVDDMPRLHAVQIMMRDDPRPVRVLIHSYGTLIDAIRMESIRLLLGEAIHIDLLDHHASYYFRELYYPTPVTEHPTQKSPVALDFAARAVLAKVAPEAILPGPSRLFVGRSASHGRVLTNDLEVRALVESHGFTVVDPEGMSFADQVRLFAGAQVVIGQMGAAMTNVMFCRPTTTTVYLAPTGWIEPFYWDLSVVRGHHYRVLFGDVPDPEVPAHQSDFTIDLISLVGVIEAL